MQWVLVLDDYHVITAPEVHEAISFLLDHAPDQLHLMMATRADPPLPLARLRSRGQLVEVRGADLRFTPAEAQQFLNQAMGLDLAAADVDAARGAHRGLDRRPPARRALVAGDPDPARGRGLHRGVHRQQPVRHRLPGRRGPGPAAAREVRDFLLRTAVLDRLTGPLCDAVTGQSGGAAMLADLERANLFLVPLDTERSWYRYHHLFADVLHARLLTEDPDLVPQLHRRASDWYAVARPRRRRRPARAGRRGLRPCRLPGGGGAARGAPHAAGQPAARLGPGPAATPSSAGARC